MVVANTVGPGTTPTATGMNVEKLLAASEILNKYDVPENDRYVAMSAKQHAELLADQRTTSRDYIGTFTLENGRITNFVGFNIILSERLPKSGSDRECLFWQKDGLLLAVNEDVVTKISERPILPIPSRFTSPWTTVPPEWKSAELARYSARNRGRCR